MLVSVPAPVLESVLETGPVPAHEPAPVPKPNYDTTHDDESTREALHGTAQKPLLPRQSGYRTMAVLLGVFVLACVLGYLVVREAVSSTIVSEAHSVAEIVAEQATTARSVYAREVAAKLSRDGFGPHVNSADLRGHVPLPAQFLKLVGRAASERSDRLFEIKPVSKWYLEPTQGLADDFLRWAWPQLEAQDQTAPAGPIAWRAVSRIESIEGRRVLRYLWADAASQEGCAACHNAYEQTATMQMRRTADGVAPGKQWRQHQLLGALAITIPLDKAEQLAGLQIGQTTAFFFAILVASFGAMFWFNWRLTRQQLSLQAAEAQVARSEVEARSAQKLRRLATHDALTGLANRELLRERMQHVLVGDRRMPQRAAVLFIDLDQFKTVNDSLGHETGDCLLVEVARRLVTTVRAEDTVARQGGDEFIVFLPRIADIDTAAHIAEKLVRQLAEPFRIAEQELYIGSSIGIAVFPEHGRDVDTLLKNSDTAMYRVKEGGRNHHAFFAPQMNEAARERYELGSELRRAVQRDEFALHFQPIVAMASGRIEALEVLLRWQHPGRGLVPPTRFIPLAESSGQVVALGEWVLRAACRQLRAWRHSGLAVPRLAINLSAIEVQQTDFVPRVRAILADAGIEPQALEFEITEGSLMSRTDEVLAKLRELSALGLKLSIDDFGTGYSSLSYLKLLPIDTLKVDRSFVQDIGNDADDTAIVVAVLAMAHSLKLKVVAEGVETQAQRHFLHEQGCDYYQGYLASHPLPADEVPRLLQENVALASANTGEAAHGHMQAHGRGQGQGHGGAAPGIAAADDQNIVSVLA
jgi:diguanylate cyclase (GGDEF)-like protein